ncbi:MAG: TlpA family protein disulfide reductase [Bacteroidaceae bacterium]|nr:TlpA family protein disulfide reductase [Bacteroidaceae bacterium]
MENSFADTIEPKVNIPAEIVARAMQWDYSAPLPIPEYCKGKAVVKGHVYGVAEGKTYIVSVSPRGIVDGDSDDAKYRVQCDRNGDFSLEVPLSQSVSPAFVRIDDTWLVEEILIENGKTTEIYYDDAYARHEKALYESKQRYTVVCGPYNDINNAFDRQEYSEIFFDRFADRQGRGYEEWYQEEMVEFVERKIDIINSKPITPRAKQYYAMCLRTEIPSQLITNIMLMSEDQKRHIWYPRSIYRLLKDERYFPKSKAGRGSVDSIDDGNVLKLLPSFYQYGSSLYHAFSKDEASMRQLYGENLDKTAPQSEIAAKREAWEKEVFGDNSLFDELQLAYICNEIFDHLEPLSEQVLAQLKQHPNKAFAELLLAKNAELIACINGNKNKGKVVPCNLPEYGDSIISEIMKKHAGKVIYMDVWATWCSPCRSAIEEMEPYKDEFKAKDVVFVYLTDESSPQQVWENCIQDYDGEHYRITKLQMQEIFKKYGFRGWPSYLIIGKDGKTLYQSKDTYIKDMVEVLRGLL